MQDNQEVSKTFCREAPNPSAFRREIEVEILCYHGEEACPKWIDKEPGSFHNTSLYASSHFLSRRLQDEMHCACGYVGDRHHAYVRPTGIILYSDLRSRPRMRTNRDQGFHTLGRRCTWISYLNRGGAD